MTKPLTTPTKIDADDSGFTLVEVVVALGLLGIIATATLGFFISGVRTSTDLQRRQVAVALANAAVEDSRRLPVTMQSTTVNGTTTTWPLLVKGRPQADVTTQWASAPSSVTSTTFPASDPSATTPAAALAPLSSKSTVGSASYTTSVVIGTCYRLRSTASAPCDQAGRARSATPPAGYEELVRISATTSWGTALDCASGTCSYTASVLVDTSPDPLWNTSGGRAVDDVASAAKGATVELNVLANDTMIPAANNPVTVVSTPAGMTASADANGRILLTVPASASTGTVVLTYSVRDAYGATSNTASVQITVTQ